MGLDTTHDCWHGAYSAFNRWRAKVAEVAGYGSLYEYQGYGGNKDWRSPEQDILIALLDHSDCDGLLPAVICEPLANRLAELLPALRIAGDGFGHIGSYAQKAEQFIAGLRAAAAAGEDVEFY